MGEADEPTGGEPTRAELWRWMGHMQGMISELRAESREVMTEWRVLNAAAALLAQRVTHLERAHEDQEARLRLVADDLTGRKENVEKSKRTNMWMATAISVVGLVAGLIFQAIK